MCSSPALPTGTIRPCSLATVAIASLVLALVPAACGDDAAGQDGRITASIASVSPEAGFIPAEITFVGEVAAAEDVDVEGLELSWDFGDGSGSTNALTVTHLYETEGAYTVRFTVRERSGGEVVDEDTASTIINIYAKADLRVSIPFLDARAVRSQDDLRVTFDVFNDASEVPIAFSAGVYLAQEGAVDHGDPPDAQSLANLAGQGRVYEVATTEFASFGAEGSAENVDLQGIRVPSQVPSGTYEVMAFVDNTGVVGEFDEVNNVQFAANTLDFINTSSEGPDLAVTRVRARPTRTNALDSVTLDIEVTNHGNEPAVDFDYDVYLSFSNDLLEAGDELIGSGTIDVVGAGTETELDGLTFTLPEPVVVIGTYFVLVEVDPSDAVEEANESNNVGVSQAITVTDQPIPGTDLIPTSFTFDPLTTFLDGSVTLVASVINQGEEDTPQGFFCRVYLSDDDDLDTDEDNQLDTFNFPTLAASEELEIQRITRIPGFFSPGRYYLFLYCDPTGQIPEADEDNNILRADGRLEISTDPEIDLRFGSFDISPRTVENGEDLHIEMQVCNDGTNGVGPSIARVHISQDPALDIGDTLLLQVDVPPVDADACVDVVRDVPAICDTFQPNYNVFATLDATDLLPETNEENNSARLDTQLTIEGVFCICEIDPLEGDNDSPATPTYVTAREYCDLSMCDSAVDWYAVPLRRGETVRAFITFDDDRGNLDMTLYGADRASVLDQSTSEGDREEVIAFVVPETGEYLIKVGGRTDLDVNVYCMTVEVTQPQSGIDLIVSGITLSNTRPVLGEEIAVTFEVINLGDTAAGPNTVRLYVSEDIEIDPGVDELLGELDLEEVRGATLLRRTLNVNVPSVGPGGGRYIGIIADALNEVPGELDETNNIGVSDLFELDAGCFDALEPNNSLDDPTEVGLTGEVTSFPELLVCSDNRDFYRVCGEAGEFLLMRARFDPLVGDIDMRLYDEAGAQLMRAEGTGAEEVIEVDFLSADQCYTLEVLVVGRNREVPYDLVIENGPAPPELVCSGAGEPNESFGTAAVLVNSLDPVLSDLSICPVTDTDFYSVELSSGTTFTVRLIPGTGADQVPSDLRMSLWSRSQAFLTNTVSATEPLSYVVTSSGRYYLRVTSLAQGPRNQRYQFDIDGLEGVDLTLTNYEITPAIADAGDRVQFTFTMVNNRLADAGGFSYGVYLSPNPIIETDSDLLLREVAQPGLAGTSSLEIGSKVTIPDGTNQGVLHYLGVVVDNRHEVSEEVESNNIAVLPLQIIDGCERDIAEPNDLRVDGPDLEDYLDVDLTLCNDDLDWFVFHAGSGQTYTLDATFDSEDGDLDLFAFNSTLGLLGEGVSIGDDESVTFTTPSGGGGQTVYILAEPFGLTNVTYVLSLD